MLEAYLDIETTGFSASYSRITVIGIYLTDGGADRFIQLVGDEISPQALIDALAGVKVIYTYNGSGFDLPFIKLALSVDLTCLCRHHDLMLDCWRENLYGGFKAVESRLGISRELKGVDGRDAVRLWWRYDRYNDRAALAKLLKYNSEDVKNLKVLRDRLLPGHAW